MPKERVAICPYFPLVPLLFSPLANLTPAYALLAWQILSTAALAVSCFAIDRLRDASGHRSFWLAFIFLPVVHCLFIGQSAIFLGLLPLSLGFLLWRRHKPLAAGLVWSLAFLKPQFLLVPAFIGVVSLFRKEVKTLAGLVIGVLLLCAAAVLIFGVDGLKLWAQAMPVVETVYSSAKNGVVLQVVASVPRMIILSAPHESLATVKACIAVASAVLALAALVAGFRLARQCADQTDFKNATLLLALSLVPLLAPYLFFYDLSVFFLAWAAVRNFDSLERWLAIAAAYIDMYGIIVVVPLFSKLATPWILMLLYLEMYRRLLVRTWHCHFDTTAEMTSNTAVLEHNGNEASEEPGHDD
jgi:hypothetical protein